MKIRIFSDRDGIERYLGVWDMHERAAAHVRYSVTVGNRHLLILRPPPRFRIEPTRPQWRKPEERVMHFRIEMGPYTRPDDLEPALFVNDDTTLAILEHDCGGAFVRGSGEPDWTEQ